jgi:hypothetical protein
MVAAHGSVTATAGQQSSGMAADPSCSAPSFSSSSPSSSSSSSSPSSSASRSYSSARGSAVAMHATPRGPLTARGGAASACGVPRCRQPCQPSSSTPLYAENVTRTYRLLHPASAGHQGRAQPQACLQSAAPSWSLRHVQTCRMSAACCSAGTVTRGSPESGSSARLTPPLPPSLPSLRSGASRSASWPSL